MKLAWQHRIYSSHEKIKRELRDHSAESATYCQSNTSNLQSSIVHSNASPLARDHPTNFGALPCPRDKRQGAGGISIFGTGFIFTLIQPRQTRRNDSSAQRPFTRLLTPSFSASSSSTCAPVLRPPLLVALRPRPCSAMLSVRRNVAFDSTAPPPPPREMSPPTRTSGHDR